MKKYKWLAGFLAITMMIGSGGCGKTLEQVRVVPESTAETEAGGETEEDSIGENTENNQSSSEESQSADDQKEEKAEKDGMNKEDMGENNTDTQKKDMKYEYMTASSILSRGNNYRLKKVMEKAKNGESLNIVTLGGSVTEGALAEPRTEGYAYLFAKNFEANYGGKINFINAGLSGTPSALGVMRYGQDVLEPLGGVPDILVIEFAVNDWQEVTTGRAYESLIYQALTDNPECAVILMFAVTSKKWSLQPDLQEYGFYYQLPMVSMTKALEHPAITDEEYFGDEFHPTNAGQKVMGDCLMKLIDTLAEEEIEEPFEIPEEAKNGRDFMHMTMVREEADVSKLSKGSFDKVDTAVQNCVFTDGSSFPNNFYNDGTGDHASLVMELDAKRILIDCKSSGSTEFGEAEIVLDGKVVQTVNGYTQGGWNSSNVLLILDENETAHHTLEVRMCKGQEDKKFTVYAVSYN